MNKIIGSGMMLLAGAASLPLALPPSARSPLADYREDSRLLALRAFFREIDGPALEYAGEFLEAADRYALDWRLLPSIACVESAGGRTAHNNNLFGWDSGHAKFRTPAAGIREVAYRLSHGDRFGNASLDQKLARYNPDSGYARKVRTVMRRISFLE